MLTARRRAAPWALAAGLSAVLSIASPGEEPPGRRVPPGEQVPPGREVPRQRQVPPGLPGRQHGAGPARRQVPADFHRRLLVYLDREGRERPVRTPEEWRLRRRRILHDMELAMGALPDRRLAPPLDVEVRGRREGPGYTRLEISFLAEEGDRVPAYLFLPYRETPGGSGEPPGGSRETRGRSRETPGGSRGTPGGSGETPGSSRETPGGSRERPGAPPLRRYPAVIALHPTHRIGKGVVAGLSERPGRAYGLELAVRGYVVLAPDYPSFGDYPYDFSADRYASGTMKGIWNHIRCVDLLQARPDVDPDRIGVIGHSLGGHNALFAAAFDERIRAVVSSCGWTPFHDYYGGRIAGWTSPRYMPRLRERYGLDPDRVPFDFYEVVAALAPRPFFSSSPLHDDNFDVEGVRKAIREARKVYELLGTGERLVVRHPDCGHEFPSAVREEAYRFLDEALGHRPAAAAVPPNDGRLWAGAAEVDITPPPGFRLSGYFHERLATGTHDPLRAKALYLRSGEEECALVVCDLIGVPREVSALSRRLAAEESGVPAERIVIGATHTHTGPLYFGVLRDLFHKRALEAQGRDPAEPFAYDRRLVERIAEVVRRARNLASPARIRWVRARVEGLAFNRRFYMKDGSVRFNPGKKNPEIVRPAGPTDPTADWILFERIGEDEPFAGLFVFALHLDTAGGTEYSADYPYYVEQVLRRRFSPRFLSVFAPGTCGDINHIDVSDARPQRGQDEARRIGEALARALLASYDEAVPVEGPLRFERRRLALPLQRFEPRAVEQSKALLERLGRERLPFLEVVRAVKILDLARRGGPTLEAEVDVLKLGRNAAVAFLPGEVFVELGLAIKRDSPFPLTAVVELANDAPAYIPTRKAFEEGSYEVVNSRIAPGGGEALVEAALDLLRSLAR